MRIAVVAVFAVLAGASGCERHQVPAAAGAPEHMHDALSGDLVAQGVLARCYAKAGDCPGIPQDAAMACAWRGVRLASHSPNLALSDTEDFAVACALLQGATKQRAEIALADYAARIWGPERAAAATLAPQAIDRVLYPSAETVRQRINFALAKRGRRERLPPYGEPAAAAVALSWSSCSDGVCLTAASPAFGGGLYWYRVSVRRGPAGEAADAGRLAAAGLEWPTAGAQAQPGQGGVLGSFCWKADEDAKTVSVTASLAPCARGAAG